MAQLGRPPLARNVYSIGDPLSDPPRSVILDTSFLVRAFVSSEPLHQLCSTFLADLVARETVVYYNALTDVELAEAGFRIAIRDRHGSRRGARDDRRISGRAGRMSSELLEAWSLTLSTVSHARIEIGELDGTYLTLMTRYGLGSADAVHVATAHFVHADAVVTTDAGFGNVPAPELRLFVDPSRVSSCRRRRGATLR